MQVTEVSRDKILGPVFLLIVLLVVGGIGCGGPSPKAGGNDQAAVGPDGLPELTKEVIDERINDARVYDVKPESGTGDPISWGFDEDEPKEIVVIDKQVDGPRATLVLDIKTQTTPRARTQRYLAGQMRTDWELTTGWVLRRWEIINTENISIKYRDLPKSLPENANNSAP